ncbi:MAG TPA: cyclase family protein [Phycisphaerales bacterium]|nr:cyclase family protein [Phycisphaerales bacterium]
MIYDISPVLSTRTNVWPGDTPLSRSVLCDLERGDNITLSSITTTLHLGAHADGPNHYARGAQGVGERALAYFLGPCQVVDAPVKRGTRVRPQDLRLTKGVVTAPRVLIRTGTFADGENWNSDFAGLSPEVIDFLAEQLVYVQIDGVMKGGVITVGIDTPSVDLQESKDLPAHRAIARHDMTILEGLVLRDVPPGDYELIALPLRMVGFDASPVRAVLRTHDHLR